MSFPAKVKEDVLVASERRCCLCHKFCGIKIEVHHIVQVSEGGTDTFDNAIALCFDCHADMRTYDAKHPKGVKYTRDELVRRRDLWYKRIANPIALLPHSELRSIDCNIFKCFCDVLPWSGSIRFLKSHNFSGFSFKSDRLDDLLAFIDKCENPMFEFVDTDLEGLKVRLREACLEFYEFCSLNTFPLDRDSSRQTVPSEWYFADFQRFEKVVDGLHKKARSVVIAYNALVRLGVRKLGVTVDVE